MKMLPDDPLLRDARILAVDDEPANLSLVEKAFQREGITSVRTFLDANTALDAFAAEPPDLVLLDLMMPGIDG
jgi:CheY-like chemotaxis protein